MLYLILILLKPFKNDETKKLSWTGDKIANVFALATRCDKVMVFTNVADVTSVAKNFVGKYSQVTYEELINIERDVFNNIKLLAQKRQPKNQQIKGQHN